MNQTPMSKEIRQHKVVNIPRFSYDLILFEWGNGYRVKYTKTNHDPHNTLLIDHLDEFHRFLKPAQDRYNALSAYITKLAVLEQKFGDIKGSKVSTTRKDLTKEILTPNQDETRDDFQYRVIQYVQEQGSTIKEWYFTKNGPDGYSAFIFYKPDEK